MFEIVAGLVAGLVLFHLLAVVVGVLPRIAGWMYRLVPGAAAPLPAPPSSVPAPMVA